MSVCVSVDRCWGCDSVAPVTLTLVHPTSRAGSTTEFHHQHNHLYIIVIFYWPVAVYWHNFYFFLSLELHHNIPFTRASIKMLSHILSLYGVQCHRILSFSSIYIYIYFSLYSHHHSSLLLLIKSSVPMCTSPCWHEGVKNHTGIGKLTHIPNSSARVTSSFIS